MAVFSIGAVLVFAGVLCLIEVPKLVQKGWYRELWVFSILLGIGVTLVFLISLGVMIPSPHDLIIWIMGRLIKMVSEFKQ